MATRVQVQKEVELGFLETPEDLQLLTSAHFPSKVGGKPAWLDHSHLPSPDDLTCGSCGKPMAFLLQVYAPRPVVAPIDQSQTQTEDEERPRSLFVFMCRNASCHGKGTLKCFKVLRCELDVERDGTSLDNGSSGDLKDRTVCSEASLTSLSHNTLTHSNGDMPICVDVSSDLASLRNKLNDTATADSLISTELSTTEASPDGMHNPPSQSPTSPSRNGTHNSSPEGMHDPSCSGTRKPSSQSPTSPSRDGVHNPPSQSPTSPTLCVVCGCSGPKRCSRCAQANYCSKEHQTHDWREGHKKVCGDLLSGEVSLSDLRYNPSKGMVLPEYEIVTELEPELSKLGNGKPERSEEERMADYYKFVRKSSGSGKGGAKELSAKELKDAATSEHNIDKQFRAFKKRVAIEPEQVIRYQRDGQPLLVSVKGAPRPGDIPNCSCGARRAFEFQIMPQLLYYLKLDSVSGPSIDWGTLLIYTCSNDNCSRVGRGYQQEVIWRQDFT